MNRVIISVWDGDKTPGGSLRKFDLKTLVRLWHGIRRHVPDGVLVVMCSMEYYGDLLQELDAYVKSIRTIGKRNVEADNIGKTLLFERTRGFGVGGSTPIMETFRPELHQRMRPLDRAVWVDWRTIITGECSWLFDWKEASVGLTTRNGGKMRPGSSIITFNQEGASLIWEYYLAICGASTFPHKFRGHPSAFGMIRHLWGQYKWPFMDLEKASECRLHGMQDDNLRESLSPHWSMVYFPDEKQPSDLSPRSAIRKEWMLVN